MKKLTDSHLLTDIFQKKKKTFSFEVFPAKTINGHLRLMETIRELCMLQPDFISCTYGAGGGTRERTFDVVEHIQNIYAIPAMAHLTCIGHSRSEIEKILSDFKKRGIVNILALRGDPPVEERELPSDSFIYSSDLVALIRKKENEKISIAVAGFPEKHLESSDMNSDINHLKGKINAGADFIITQLFFDNSLYFDYAAKLKRKGIEVRVIPGILPITDYPALKRFCNRCGTKIPHAIKEIFEPLSGNPDETSKQGIAFAVKQSQELLSGGAPGIHFYTLNKADITTTLWNELFSDKMLRLGVHEKTKTLSYAAF